MHEHESLPGRLEACLSSDEMAHSWLMARGEGLMASHLRAHASLKNMPWGRYCFLNQMMAILAVSR